MSAGNFEEVYIAKPFPICITSRKTYEFCTVEWQGNAPWGWYFMRRQMRSTMQSLATAVKILHWKDLNAEVCMRRELCAVVPAWCASTCHSVLPMCCRPWAVSRSVPHRQSRIMTRILTVGDHAVLLRRHKGWTN